MYSSERKDNLTQLNALLKKKKSDREIHSFLLAKGVSKAIADDVLVEFHRSKPEPGKWMSLLKVILARKIKTTSLSTAKHVALVGPTGVGKTTTLLKLHQDFSKEKRVGIISLDIEKGGAKEQIERHAPLWDTSQAVELLLIDTQGCNYYERDRVERVAESLMPFGELDIHLTLSAGAKEVDLYGAIHQFSCLSLKSLIFTKLDETLSLGVLLNVSAKVEIPISYVAYGYPLPGKIVPANSLEIAHKILADTNEENFHYLRQLACNNNN